MPLPDLILPIASIGLLGAMAVKQATVRKPGQIRPLSKPGFLAHWRAGRGVTHPRQGVGIGYQSGLARVSLSAKELGRHGVVWGATGVGKTTLLALLAQGFSRIGAVIVLDGKGNSGPGSLQAAISAAGGLVWTIGGGLKLDLLDTDPTALAEQLTEAARHEGPSEVYSEAAARTIQWIGYVLKWRHQTPTLERVEALLQPGMLEAALQDFKSEPRVRIWLQEIEQITSVELSGMATALMRVTRLLDSAAGLSLGAGPDAIRLDDVVQTRSMLLLSANSRRYPGIARIMGGWALVAMQRACESVPRGKQVLLIVDEVASFQGMAKHLEPLLATARDAGVGVVVAAHGPGELDGAHRGLSSQVMSLVTWQIMMRVGDTTDADRLSTYFPLRTDERISLGTHAQGVPSVTRDCLIGLGVGNCLYHVAPTDGRDGIRWGAARIARPKQPGALPLEPVSPAEMAAESGVFEIAETLPGASEPAELDAEAGDRAVDEGAFGPIQKRVDEVKSLVCSKIKVEDGWRVWTGNFDTQKGYPRIWVRRSDWNGKLKKWVGRWHLVHRLVCEWEQGEIPKGWTVDHECGLKRCLDHLATCTRPENTKRERERERGERPTGHPQPTQLTLEVTPSDESALHRVEAVEPVAAMESSATVRPQREALTVDERRAEVQRLRAAGWSFRRIAEQLEVSLGTVHADADAVQAVQSGVQTVQSGVQAVQSGVHAEHVEHAGVQHATAFAIARFARYDRPSSSGQLISRTWSTC